MFSLDLSRGVHHRTALVPRTRSAVRFASGGGRVFVAALMTLALLLPSAAGFSRLAQACCCKTASGATCPMKHHSSDRCTPSHGGCSMSRRAASERPVIGGAHIEIAIILRAEGLVAPPLFHLPSVPLIGRNGILSAGPDTPPPRLA
jgi:hypothetical protein